MKDWVAKFSRITLVMVALIWSSGGLVVKLSDCSALVLSGIRCFLANLVLLAIFKNQISFRLNKVIVIGALSYAGMALGYAVANKLTTAANAVVLQYTAPIFVALLSFPILGERIRKSDWLAVSFVFLGMVLCFFGDLNIQVTTGNFVALFSGLCLATFTICCRILKNQNPANVVFWGNLVVMLITAPFFSDIEWSYTTLIAGAYFGLIFSGLAYALHAMAICHVTALTSVLILTIEPVLNPIWVFFATNEYPQGLALLGGFLILITLIFRNTYGSEFEA